MAKVRASIRCAIPHDAEQYANAAAEWAEAFHPGLEAAIAGNHVLLASDLHPTSQLEAIWASSLANERLVHESAPARAVIMARLLG